MQTVAHVAINTRDVTDTSYVPCREFLILNFNLLISTFSKKPRVAAGLLQWGNL